MHKLNLPPHILPRPFPALAVQEWSTLPEFDHHCVPEVYLRNAVQVLSEYDLPLPDQDQLNLIVTAALAARTLFFTACLHQPEETELYQVFEMFVMACVTPIPETESV